MSRKRFFSNFGFILTIISVLLLANSPFAFAGLSPEQQKIFDYGLGYYNVDIYDESCQATTTTSTTNVNSSAAQEANAKIVIGVAKTDSLEKNAALIGLMVALAESGLRELANENVPLSENNPNKQGDGSDHDSLGMFQQRISANWSTISTDANNAAAVNQLMTPAYNAEAFFGSSPGNNGAPSALRKGLQNVGGWQTMDPWVAAQAVQGSNSSNGSNYQAQMKTAQSLLDQFWDSSPPVPLPVALTSASAPTSGDAGGAANPGVSPNCGGAATTVNSANAPGYCKDGSATGTQKVVCSAWLFDNYGYNSPGCRGSATSTWGSACNGASNLSDMIAGVKACDNNNYGSGCKYPRGDLLVDCSGLVDAALFDGLGIDMNGASTGDYPNNSHLKEIPLSQAQPGDIAWWSDNGTADAHAEVIVSYDSSTGTFYTFGAHMHYSDVSQDIASASYPSSGGGWAVQKVFEPIP